MKYYRPTTMRDFMDLSMDLADQNATLLAGGTDLIPRFERGHSMPDHLIDLKKLADLYQVNIHDDHIQIGTLTTIQSIADHPVIKADFKAIHMAATDFAGAQIRHRGTIGGNIVNASPAGDLLPGLYVFGAQLTLIGPEGERQVPLKQFILGPGRTDLKPGEILVSINMDRTSHDSTFQKIGLRRSMAISVVNLAIVSTRDASGFTHLKIAAGAVAPTVVTLDKLSSSILDKTSTPGDWPALIKADIAPIDDIRATARYRAQVTINLIQAFLSEAS